MNEKIFFAVKAFIKYNNKILILKESSCEKFGVVGGRLEPGEKLDEALRREIREETGLEAKIGKQFYVDEWNITANRKQLHIIGIFFECEALSDNIRLSNDHSEFKWINPKDYKKYDLFDNLKGAFETYLK